MNLAPGIFPLRNCKGQLILGSSTGIGLIGSGRLKAHSRRHKASCEEKQHQGQASVSGPNTLQSQTNQDKDYFDFAPTEHVEVNAHAQEIIKGFNRRYRTRTRFNAKSPRNILREWRAALLLQGTSRST